MTTPPPTSAVYQLPRTAREARRLDLQDEYLRPATEELLAATGLPAGTAVRCLDVGCGTGSVMELLARTAAGSSLIVGLDLDTSAARARLVALTHPGVRLELVEGDLFEQRALPGAPYDLTFSRYMLHHVADPVAALGRMWELTRPGGRLALLDIDQGTTTTCPSWRPYQELEDAIHELYRRIGIDKTIGHKLPALFEAAGIGRPDGIQVRGIMPTIAELAEFLALLFDAVRDKLVEHGVISHDDVSRLERELATAPAQVSTYCLRPLSVGVWKRKP
ncbi:MAG TPA: methyltransferase domain-containing protein [Kofleriaceae bacterium]|nr:methyltransferase domain-containing protein [Kofleriaceae bacterium]